MGNTIAMSLSFTSTRMAAASPREARQSLARQLSAWGLTQVADDVELIASELVTNAIRHGGGVAQVSLTARDGRVQIEVGDYSRTPPTPPRDAGVEPSGRGMMLVEALSSRWGVRPEPQGKTVWAEIIIGDR